MKQRLLVMAMAGLAIAFGCAPASAQATLETCFNGGLYKKGTFVDYQVRRTTEGFSEERRFTYDVRSVTDFKGVDAIELETEIFHATRTETSREYVQIEGADVLRYGLRIPGATISARPAERTPGGLAVGDNFKQSYVLTVDSTSVNAKRTVKFNGFQTLSTPFGSFRTCKLTKTTVTKVDGRSVTRSDIEWYAADGPYQGFKLKYEQIGSGYSYVFDVLKINKFKLK